MKKLKVHDRKVKFWFKFGPYFDITLGLLSTDIDINNIIHKVPDSREVKIFVEHTDEDQWTYDVVNIEGA